MELKNENLKRMGISKRERSRATQEYFSRYKIPSGCAIFGMMDESGNTFSGSAGNFLGEYMAGGIIILLGLYRQKLTHFPYSGVEQLVGDYVGTGMHGGTIYIRGDVADHKLGKEVKKMDLDDVDIDILDKYIGNYCKYFNIDKRQIKTGQFIKLIPFSHRPYGRLYTY